MKALQKTSCSFGLELRDIEPPKEPGKGEIILEVTAAGICGSDVHIYEWTPGFEYMAEFMPVTIGHEFCGRVAVVGPDVTKLSPGDRVVVIPYSSCGKCRNCEAGLPDLCEHQAGSIGLKRNGGFSRFIPVPSASCLRIPDHIPDEIAALTEPLTVGARAVDNGGVRVGDRVLVLGPGTIGQAIALMARRAGAREVVVAGKDDAERLACVRRLGFEKAIDVGDGTVADAVRRSCGDVQFDVVFEATGVPQIIDQALRVTRRRGIVVVVGIHPTPASIDLTRLVREQQQIRGSHRAPRNVWLRVIDMISEEWKTIGAMISDKMPLERAVEGMELARSRRASKVLIIPD